MPPKTKVDLKKLEAERLQALLLDMTKEEENKYCADCEAKQPRWASWNLGVFLCIRCAGLHRNLGVHISKVKSVNLDSWTPEQVQSMRVMGNAKAKAVYEAELPDMFRRPQTDQALEQFIRAKYEQKRYLLREWSPPKVDIRDLPPLNLHEKNHPKVSPTSSQGSISGLSLSKPPIAGQPGQVKIPTNTPSPAIIDEQLLDFGSPTSPTNTSQATAQPSGGNVIDLFSPTGSSGSGTVGTPTQGKVEDLDDIFGPMVSVPTAMTSSVSASATPSIEHPPQDHQNSASLGDLNTLLVGSDSQEKKTTSDILSLFKNTQPTAYVAPVQNALPQQMIPGMGMNNFNVPGGIRPMNVPPVQGYGVQNAPPQMYNQMMPNLAQPGMIPQMIPTQPTRPTGSYGMDTASLFTGASGFSTPPAQSQQPIKPAQPAPFNPNAFSLFSGDSSLTFNAFSGSSNSATLNPTPSNNVVMNNSHDLGFGNLSLGTTNSQPVASSNTNTLDLLFS